MNPIVIPEVSGDRRAANKPEKLARVGPQDGACIVWVNANPALEEDEAVGLEFPDVLDHVRGVPDTVFMNSIDCVTDVFQGVGRVSFGRPTLIEIAEE